ncbi:MAG: prepilin-type N-terminal cleavage/methylation domain-containing protein [Deltaproteobacteria bacterium]|nr:prepilin-type N-terminal cleavage/methylation domain-containing protein [Deltaproteobacteria bacterium]
MKRKRRTGKERTSKGFTLVEILIAIFIFALIASAIFTAYTGTLKMMDQTESRADTAEMAGIALERISEDLESAYFPRSVHTPGPAGTEDQEILFAGEKKEEEPGAEPTEIVYYATEDDDNLLTLYRSDTPLARDRPDSEKGGLLLCQGLSSISFTYYDSEGEAHDTWDPGEGTAKGKLPSRVAISLEFTTPADPDTPYRFMTAVAIPMGG